MEKSKQNCNNTVFLDLVRSSIKSNCENTTKLVSDFQIHLIRGRQSSKKVDKGIICSICQDDLSEGDLVLQLD